MISQLAHGDLYRNHGPQSFLGGGAGGGGILGNRLPAGFRRAPNLRAGGGARGLRAAGQAGGAVQGIPRGGAGRVRGIARGRRGAGITRGGA